jgi:hypothetical protein
MTGVHGASRRQLVVAVVLLVIGLLGHVLAARASGGSAIAYQHHILGFFLILLVTGVMIAGLGWFFWRSRRDVTAMAIAAVQAIFGVLVYLGQVT